MSELSWKDMQMYEEYFERTKYYMDKYGPQTILLMQAGAFYEVYAYKTPDSTEYQGSLILKFSEVCNNVITLKTKSKYKTYPLYIAGAPEYKIDRYVKQLVDVQCTVVVISQNEKMQTSGAKKKERYVEGIYSPGTYMTPETQTETRWSNHLMCIWMHLYKGKYTMGMSLINIYTGQSYFFEHALGQGKIESTHFDELDRCLTIYRPREVIFVCDDPEVLPQIVLLKDVPVHSFTLQESFVKNATEQVYCRHIVSKYFGDEAFTQCAEFAHYEIATQCFCVLTHFLEERNPSMCKNVQLPVWENNTTAVRLANHTLQQLNILDTATSSGHNLSSVHAWTNKCVTVMGKRLFLTRLTHPTFDEKQLESHYAATEQMIQSNMMTTVRRLLRGISDIQTLTRQMVTMQMNPSSLYKLYSSLDTAEQLLTCCGEMQWLFTYLGVSWPELQEDIQKCTQFIDSRVYMTSCPDVSHLNNFEEMMFKKGFHDEYDDLCANYDKQQIQLETIRLFWERQINPAAKVGDNVKLVTTADKKHTSLQVTASKSASIQGKMKGHSALIRLDHDISFKWSDVSFVKGNQQHKEIRFPQYDAICDSICNLCSQRNTITREMFLDLFKAIETKFLPVLQTVSAVISKLDVLTNNAHMAQKYRYCRPTIDEEAEKAFVHVDELRHILIEQINTKETYVPNDLRLGGRDDIDGILLFGPNTVGKTSMMRALGIAVIMAQAGMFVPCTRFLYKPYQSIFSRILNQDNLFKGLSTFAVEMSELRVILQYANEDSLILGDELCSGTETIDALSIMMGSLTILHEQRSTFLFATHFHEIVDYSELEMLTRMKCYHLAISYDGENKLVFDRKLKEGSGPRSYGLEICESFFMPDDMLEIAYKFRSKNYPEYAGSLSRSKTRYNAKKIKGACEICGGVSSDIHHIQEQHLADAQGYINNTFHKNHPANLMSLCEKCHQKTHHASEDTDSRLSPLTTSTAPKRKIVKRKTNTSKTS